MTDAEPKEPVVYHRAGLAGRGGSSYIDSVILRDRDANAAWESQADGTLEERVYYCQNWRADVVALMTDGGELINQVRYDPYGVPFGIAKADLDADGDVDAADYTQFSTYYSAGTMPYADWNWDGTKDTADITAYLNDKNADAGLGRGDPSYAYGTAGGANRKAYAGYEIEPVLTGSEGWESVYHVRNRVLLSQAGRWTRRDPLGYVDGMSVYAYAHSPLVYIDSYGLNICPGGLCEGGSGDGDDDGEAEVFEGTCEGVFSRDCDGDGKIDKILTVAEFECGANQKCCVVLKCTDDGELESDSGCCYNDQDCIAGADDDGGLILTCSKAPPDDIGGISIN